MQEADDVSTAVERGIESEVIGLLANCDVLEGVRSENRARSTDLAYETVSREESER